MKKIVKVYGTCLMINADLKGFILVIDYAC